jgi:hypothetical protein
MPIANGVFKKVRYKRQASFGAPISGATGGQEMRRVTSDLDISKDNYRSNEMRPDMQRGDLRHGARSVGGKISGELSVGTHKDFFETFCRQTWQTPSTTGALTTVTAATTSGTQGTFTRSAGSYLTDGFAVGRVVRPSGFTTTGVGNNGKNMLIIGLSATVMTVTTLDGSAVAAKAAGDSVTIVEPGKKTWVPLSGHTNDCYTIEHWFSDIAQSEVFDSCRVANVDIGLPATGMATIDWTFLGRDLLRGTASYFTSPAATTTGRSLAAVNGVLVLNGSPVAILTALTIAGNANASTGQVVGSNVTPDVFMGPVDVTGSATVYFQDAAVRDLFVDEVECMLACAFTTDNTPGSGFMAFTLPRIKATSATKDDGEKGLTLTLAFTGLVNDVPAVGTQATTFMVQDSAA